MSSPTSPSRAGRTTPPGARPGDRLVRAGGILFLVGVLAIVATVLPLFFGWPRLPTISYLVAMLAPVGMGLALLGLLRAARSSRSPRDPAESDLYLPL